MYSGFFFLNLFTIFCQCNYALHHVCINEDNQPGEHLGVQSATF